VAMAKPRVARATAMPNVSATWRRTLTMRAVASAPPAGSRTRTLRYGKSDVWLTTTTPAR
jgi:hypothetical protein